MSEEKQNNRILGITFPNTISVGVLFVAILQGASFLWQGAKYASSMEQLSEKVEHVSEDLTKLKSSMPSRDELMIRNDALHREIDFQRKAIEDLNEDVKEIRRGR